MSNTITDDYIFIFFCCCCFCLFILFFFLLLLFSLFIVPFVFFVCLLLFLFLLSFFFPLGLNDRIVEGEFLWSDRSVVEYINWDKLNSYYSWRLSDCASVKKDNEGRWGEQSCYNRFSYICKKPKGL